MLFSRGKFSLVWVMWLLIPTNVVTLAQNDASATSNESVTKESSPNKSGNSNTNDKNPEHANESKDDVIQKAFDHILEDLKQSGDSNAIAELIIVRDQRGHLDNYPVFLGELACELIHANRMQSELLSARRLVPDNAQEKQADDDDYGYGQRMVLIIAAAVNGRLSEGKLDLAEQNAQKNLEWSQEYFGVSSRPHVEAIELLAKVRVAQEKSDEAVLLLKKSAELRAGLLGKDHPSIARGQKEIDGIRKKQLDTSEAIWTPPKDDESKSADRYGAAKPVGKAK